MKEKNTNQKIKNILSDFFISYLQKNKVSKETANIYMTVTEQFVQWLEKKYKIKYSEEIFVNHILEFHQHCFGDMQTSFLNLLFDLGKYVQQIGGYEKEQENPQGD